MDLFTLDAKSRKKTGKGFAKSLRREGFIPVTLYGLKTEPQNIIISTKELQKVLKNKKTLDLIVNVTVDGENKRPTILRELQKDPVKDTYIHADFNIIDINKPLISSIPVAVKGLSIGVEMGGMLQIIRRELIAKCLPLKIPEKIEIDVSEINIGDSVHIEDIVKNEEGIDFIYDANFTIITCTAPIIEEEKTEEDDGEEVEEGEEGSEEEKAEDTKDKDKEKIEGKTEKK